MNTQEKKEYSDDGDDDDDDDTEPLYKYKTYLTCEITLHVA
jgi:hypothetical protein